MAPSRRPPPLAWVGVALVLGVFGIFWFRPSSTPAPSPEGATDPREAQLEAFDEALDELADVTTRMASRISRFRRERRTAESDRGEIFLEDVPQLTDASVGLLWARYLRALTSFLVAARELPPARAEELDLGRLLDQEALDVGSDFYGDIRRLELRAGSLVMRGRIDPLAIAEPLRKSKERAEEIRKLTEAWPGPDAPPGLDGDPGVLIARTMLTTRREEVGLDTAIEDLLDAAAAHPQHPLRRRLFQAVEEVFTQETSTAARGIMVLPCERLEELYRRLEVEGRGVPRVASPDLRGALSAAWRCPGSELLVGRARRGWEADRDGMEDGRKIPQRRAPLCEDIRNRRQDFGVPDPLEPLTAAIETAAGCEG